MRLVALPGEITAWQRQLGSLPTDRRVAVIRMLSEVVADCRYCDGPVRRCDSRAIVRDRLVPLRCAPRYAPGEGRDQ